MSLESALGTITFRQATVGVAAGLRRLADGGATLDELADEALVLDPATPLYRLYLHVAELNARGLLEHTVLDGDRPVATITGAGRGFAFEAAPLDHGRPFVLSRFACCRRDGARMVLECPLGRARVTLAGPPAMELVGLLAEPVSVRDAAARVDAREEVVAGCFQLLINAAAVDPVDDDGVAAEDADPARAQWSFHDLLFHSRSRFGRHSEPYGANFRHADRTPPLPAVKPPPPGPAVQLPVPDLAGVARRDPPLTQALEERRSVREHGEAALTLDQLGEFLYRVARVRGTGSLPVPHSDVTMEITSRPYPTGGACYELELYAVVDRCTPLARGLYHYDPAEHRLGRLPAGEEDVDALLRYAGLAATGAKPQVMLLVAARFGRVTWKYDSIAYATILKNVGVLLQTMYLTATAMGLAGCALGSGDADAFSDAAGTDYLVESSVGEFMLGTLPTEEALT